MSKNIFTILSVIIAIIIALIAGAKQGTINDLQNQLLIVKNAPPKIITLTQNEIQYVYKDSTVIKIQHAPEAKIQMNLDKIESLYAEIGRLESQLSKAKTDTIVVTNTDSIKVAIDRLGEVLKNPIGSGLISVQKYGKLFQPCIGVGYGNSGWSPLVTTKLFFYQQYGLHIGATTGMAGIGASRHLYDVWDKLKNTEVIFMDGFSYKTFNNSMFIGLSTSL